MSSLPSRGVTSARKPSRLTLPALKAPPNHMASWSLGCSLHLAGSHG